MKYILSVLIAFPAILFSQNLRTPYEKGNGNQTADYAEMRLFYDSLDRNYANISIKKFGLTDSGEPLRVVLFNNGQNFNPAIPTILINNGIHPGEPDGIDASMQLLRNLADGTLKIPDNVTVAVIECYNIGGMLNRGKYSRANQNGPEEYGFRGNARNFDLNRDFIKADSKNAQSFQEIFHTYNPVYFIDNHVSNGADYQYTLTYITTNKERLGKELGNFQHEILVPEIKQNLLKKGIISIPYVQINGLKPQNGYEAFMDSPRYATGYTSLFNTMGEVPETHMLKPYKDRVAVTYENMVSSIEFVSKNLQKIQSVQKKNRAQFLPGKKYTVNWKLDSTKFHLMEFKGYEAALKDSEISGKPRLFYDRSKPYSMKIPFYDTYEAEKQIEIPEFYVLPKSEWRVIEHLQRNKIKMKPLKSDSTISVEVYRIADYKTYTRPYEGHYVHYDTQISSSREQVNFRTGDVLIPVNQPGAKYLLETLEPESVDSFFNWNFFDSFLSQREYYSDYVFEDTAPEILQSNPLLKAEFEKKKSEDQKFAEDGAAQLNWVYRNSEYFEKSYLRYPVYRIRQ